MCDFKLYTLIIMANKSLSLFFSFLFKDIFILLISCLFGQAVYLVGQLKKKNPTPTSSNRHTNTITMYCLSCVSITKPLALASLPTNNDSHPIQTKHTKLPMHTTEPKTTLPLPLPLPRKKKQQQQHKRQQPTIAQIERAIGAGRYRDIDARHVQFHLFLHNLNICFGVLLLTCGSEF